MKDIYTIYEGVLSDIDDTLSNDDTINLLAELKDFQKVKLDVNKDRQTFIWHCPNLLDKYLDNKLKVKFFRHEIPTEIEFLCIINSDTECQMRVYINNEKHKMRLVCLSMWLYTGSHKHSIEDLSKIIKLCCKSEAHFKMLLQLFNANYVQSDGKAPTFSISAVKQALNKL